MPSPAYLLSFILYLQWNFTNISQIEDTDKIYKNFLEKGIFYTCMLVEIASEIIIIWIFLKQNSLSKMQVILLLISKLQLQMKSSHKALSPNITSSLIFSFTYPSFISLNLFLIFKWYYLSYKRLSTIFS